MRDGCSFIFLAFDLLVRFLRANDRQKALFLSIIGVFLCGITAVILYGEMERGYPVAQVPSVIESTDVWLCGLPGLLMLCGAAVFALKSRARAYWRRRCADPGQHKTQRVPVDPSSECTSCGAWNPPGSAHCCECGAALQGA